MKSVFYGVFRRGSTNAANHLGPVAWAEGTGRDARERRASAIEKVVAGPYPWCGLHPGQYFDAVPHSRIGASASAQLDESTAALEGDIRWARRESGHPMYPDSILPQD